MVGRAWSVQCTLGARDCSCAVCAKISATREKEASGTHCLKNETVNNHSRLLKLFYMINGLMNRCFLCKTYHIFSIEIYADFLFCLHRIPGVILRLTKTAFWPVFPKCMQPEVRYLALLAKGASSPSLSQGSSNKGILSDACQSEVGSFSFKSTLTLPNLYF